MKYIWKDYEPESMGFVESWLDKDAVKMTGIEDGWEDFYEYWANEENTIIDETLWCKVVCENKKPFAVIAIGFHENKFNIMEIVVDPNCRNHGKGASLIKEFLQNGKKIIGFDIDKAEVVIYPSNPASQKAFEKAGFNFDHAHEDGDAFYYVYEKEN